MGNSCDDYRLHLPPSAFWDLQFCEANVWHRFSEKFTEYNVIIYVCKSWSLVFLNQLLNQVWIIVFQEIISYM